MSKKERPNGNKGPPVSLYRQILRSEKESALARLGAKAEGLLKTERIGEEDRAQYSLEEAVSLQLNGLEYAQLRQIQEALDRLNFGEYGVCLACEEPVPAKRLQALPWARYCVKCQEMLADNGEGRHEE